jgi:hypothetical protein
MSAYMATFYSSDDDLEHAISYNVLLHSPFASNNSFLDTSFSPATQGHDRQLPYGCPQIQPGEAANSISGLYSPLDGLRYVFLSSTANQIYVTWYSKDVHASADPRLPCGGILPLYDNPFPSYLPNNIFISDIAAFFSTDDNQIYVTVLMTNGDLWQLFGTNDLIGNWSAIPFLSAHAPAGSKKRMVQP